MEDKKTKGSSPGTKCSFCTDYNRIKELLPEAMLKAAVVKEQTTCRGYTAIRVSIPRKLRYCPTCGRRLYKE